MKRAKRVLALCLVLVLSLSVCGLPVYASPISESPSNGEGQINHILMVDMDVMPLASYDDIEVPANTAIYLKKEFLTSITMSISYTPSGLNLYYGIARENTGNGNHWPNLATNGSGSTTITPGSTRYYYLYLANTNSEAITADLTYTAIASTSLE